MIVVIRFKFPNSAVDTKTKTKTKNEKPGQREVDLN